MTQVLSRLTARNPAAVSSTELSARALRHCAKSMFADFEMDDWLQQAAVASGHQNDHGKAHGMATRKVGCYLARSLGFKGWHLWAVAVGCYCHDIGYDLEHGREGHEERGANKLYHWAKARGVSDEHAALLHCIVAGHRTRFILETGILNDLHAILVIADKVVGDKRRVQPEQRRELEEYCRSGTINEWMKLEWADRRRGDSDRAHRRINFAIQPGPRLVVDEELQEICLSLEMDTQIATPRQLLKLFKDRYRACHLAAEYLDYRFRLQINNQRYRWHGNAWTRIKGCVVQE